SNRTTAITRAASATFATIAVGGIPITLNGALLQVAADATLQIGDPAFVYASGHFVFTKAADIYITPAGASVTTRVSLLEIGISGGNLFAGVGSPIDGNGAFNPAATGAVGVSLAGVDF